MNIFLQKNNNLYTDKLTKKRGLTFIELIITIAISSIVLLALVASIRFVYRGNRFAMEQADAIREARIGVEHMVRDIRESAYSDIGDYPVVAFSQNSFTFFSDIDRDANIERVRYFLENGMLKKGLLEPVGDPSVYDPNNEVVSIISRNVRNSVLSKDLFEYYDMNGTQITTFTDVTSVAFVSVSLVVNINPLRAPEDLEIHSSASLRNINYAR